MEIFVDNSKISDDTDIGSDEQYNNRHGEVSEQQTTSTNTGSIDQPNAQTHDNTSKSEKTHKAKVENIGLIGAAIATACARPTQWSNMSPPRLHSAARNSSRNSSIHSTDSVDDFLQMNRRETEELSMIRSLSLDVAADLASRQLDLGGYPSDQHRIESYVQIATDIGKQISTKKRDTCIITNINDVQRKFVEYRHLQANIQSATANMKKLNETYNKLHLTTNTFPEDVDNLEEEFDGLKEDITMARNNSLLNNGIMAYDDMGTEDNDNNTLPYESEYSKLIKSVIAKRRGVKQ